MGTKERNFEPLPKDVSLEGLVPEDSFYRRLEADPDLSFVRALVAPLYAGGGRPSLDPVVFFRLQLVMFFEDIRSERELMRVAADRLSVRWYFGYDLHEPLPFHSSLTRARERFGVEVFREFFKEIVKRCIEAGLVWGEELFFDSTKVRADAATHSLRSRIVVENHLEELFREEVTEEGENGPGTDKIAELCGSPGVRQNTEITEMNADPEATLDATLSTLPSFDDHSLRETNAAKRDWISSGGRQNRAYISGSRKRIADRLVSTTDPDATPMPSEDRTRLGYQTHYVVDGGRARIILNALVTPFEVTEHRDLRHSSGRIETWK